MNVRPAGGASGRSGAPPAVTSPSDVVRTLRAAAPRVRVPPSPWSRFGRNRAALFGIGVITVVAAVAVLAPWVAPYDPAQQFTDGLTPEGRPLPPGGRFWLGTDLLGRDLLSRLISSAPAPSARRLPSDGRPSQGQGSPGAAGNCSP